MLICCSPTKTMNKVLNESCSPFEMKNEVLSIMNEMKKLNEDDLQSLYGCNQKIAELNKVRWQNFNLSQKSRALLTFHGLQFQRIQADDFTSEDWDYAQKYMRIMSGLYGVLRPMDGMDEYRLDVENKVLIGGINLEQFWKERLGAYFKDEVVVDCCSKEYSKLLSGQIVRVDFQVLKNGKLKNEATAAKMARGLFIRFCIKHKIEEIEELKNFHEDGYKFQEELSSNRNIVFVKAVN